MTDNNSNGNMSRFGSRLFIVVLIAVLALGSFNLVGLISSYSDKQRELSSIKAEIENQEKEIEEDEYLLDEKNELEYIERVAREKYGYAAPGERAFYVSDGG